MRSRPMHSEAFKSANLLRGSWDPTLVVYVFSINILIWRACQSLLIFEPIGDFQPAIQVFLRRQYTFLCASAQPQSFLLAFQL